MSDPQTRKLSHYFTHSKRKGRPGLPLASVTMNDGLVLRDDMDRKMDTSLSDEEHSLVEPGDIAYNMMRMWQGAFGLASAPVNVSPAYVVMRAKPTLDPCFAAHWLKSDRALYLLWAFSYGLTDDRLRLYPKEFLQIPVQWPDVAEQRRIAAVLDTWDEAIAIAEKLVAAKEKQRRGLTLHYATQPRSELVALGSVGRFVKGKGLPKSDLTEIGVPCLRYAEIYTRYRDTTHALISRTSEDGAQSSRPLRHGDIVFAASGETAEEIGKALAYLAHEQAVVGSDTVVLTEHGQNAAYLAHVLNAEPIAKQKAAAGKGHSVVHIHAPDLAKLLIPLPPLAEQNKVAAALQAIEEQIGCSLALVSHLRTQKRGMMEKLLTGQWRVPESIDALQPAAKEVAA